MTAPKDRREKDEGWESLGQEDEGTLAPNEELEQALREAEASWDARHPAGAKAAAAPQAARAEEVAALEAKLAELQDRHLRLQADFENLRRRTLRDREEAHQFGHQNLVKDLLSTVDNLERAMEHARKSGPGDFDGLLQGIELVQRELGGVLAKYGVTEIEAQGTAFDPAVHEAMAQVPDDSVPPGTVVQVFQPGYRLRDRLLRPAQVVVSGASQGAREKSESEAGS
jgi:molecular chaperone GrpE